MYSHRAHSRITLALALLGLGGALLPLSGASQAVAATVPVVWTQSIQGGVAGEVDPQAAILTHTNGDVTFGGCSQAKPLEAIETWTSGHHLVGSRPTSDSPDPTLCDGTGLTDQQGNVYSVLADPTTGKDELMAFKPNGSDLWPAPTPLPTTCVGNPDSLGYSQPVLGADGNIYGLDYYGQINSCPTALKLYGINHKTGALLFADTLNPDGSTVTSDVNAYDDGLIVRSNNQVTYYSYGGTVIGGPYNMGGDQIDRDEGVAATTTGRAFVATAKTTTATSSCPLTFVMDAVEAFQPSGRLWRTPVTGCDSNVSINAMPDGGVGVLAWNFATNPVSGTLLRYSSAGKLLWSHQLGITGDYTWPDDGSMTVDGNGDVVLVQSYNLDTSPNPADLDEPEVRVDLYNGATGSEVSYVDTADFDDNNSYTLAVNAIGLDQDRLYLGLQECPGNINMGDGTCGTAPLLYAINTLGLGIDYPRGAVLGAKPSPIYYVALGDSYSSGEGAPDPGYLSGTDIESNRCHRSLGAWTVLVHSATAAKYPFMVFRACSGAIIQDFFYSNQDNSNEPPQLSWLNGTTGLVTLTIGGDNLDFINVMTYCALRQAGDKTCQQKFGAIVSSDLATISAHTTTGISTLAALFSNVRRDAPSAKVVVVGYPRLFPEDPPKGCGTGIARYTFLQSDMRWMNAEGLKLDDAINAAAKRFGLTYVNTYDAFAGHELCQKNRYLNRAILDLRKSVQDWSFHPNLKGQRVLAAAVKPFI